jgi:hypothetical protein
MVRRRRVFTRKSKRQPRRGAGQRDDALPDFKDVFVLVERWLKTFEPPSGRRTDAAAAR